MNRADATRPGGKPLIWLRGPFLLASVPLALCVLAAVGLAVHEKQAASRVEDQLARLRQAGYPLDDESLGRWFFDHTTREGSQTWNQILRLAAAPPRTFVDVKRLPYVGTAKVPVRIAPDSDWPEENEARQYLQEMRPLLEQIHTAAEQHAPVWQPIEFQGYSTLLEELQASRSIMRLLQLEAELALYEQDAERALRALDSMQGVAEAFDWPFCIVCELVQIASRKTHQAMIRRGLETGIWNDEQLRRLADQVGPARAVEQRWRSVTGGERAMFLASLDDGDLWHGAKVRAAVAQWILPVPSMQEQLLKDYQAMQEVATDDFDDLKRRAERLDRLWSESADRAREVRPQLLNTLPAGIRGVLLPALSRFAAAMKHEETSRRFALTAVTIKRFQLQEGRLPRKLGELQRVGLEPRDWQTVSGGPFGYEARDGTAYLWTYDPQKDSRVPPQPPQGSRDELLTTIR